LISRLKCWQLNISIHISWKSGYPEFSWGVNYWGVPYISLYTSNLPEIKIYRTLKEYLSFQENWTFYLKSNYLYQLLFLVQVHILYLCMSPCQVMSTNTPSKQLRKYVYVENVENFTLVLIIPWKSSDSEFSWIYKGLFNSQNKLFCSN